VAENVTDAIIKVQRYFPDVTQTIAFQLLGDIHSELNEEFALRVTTEELAAFSPGTREYPLSEDVLAVWSAIYHESADASHRLAETSIDELDTDHGYWRNGAKGTPRRYYLTTSETGAMVGFDPHPDTMTVDGYPKVTLHVSKRAPLILGGILPPNLRSSRIYVVGAAWLYAEQMYPDRAPAFEAAYRREKGKLATYMMRRQRRSRPTIMPRWLQRARKV
jgi:hypothetical protein